MSSSFRNTREQSGAALIVALVVVLLVVLLATRVSSDYLVLFRTVENQSELQQARAYLRGAELVAEQALLRDLQAGSDIDSALEPWAQRAALPLPEGILSACLTDLQARLNLNDLGAPDGELSTAQRRFIRLLQVVDTELDSIAAASLANAVFDWIDADDTQRYPGGAEAIDYARLPQPYRAANQAFASVSELRLVKGFDAVLVAALTPHLSVWGNGSLNLNTLDAQLTANLTPDASLVMLRTLNTADSLLPLSNEGARLLASARNERGIFENFDVFAAAPFAVQQWELSGLALNSTYFELTAVMQSGRRSYAMQSVLRRAVAQTGVPEVTVVSRRYAGVHERGASCAAALP
ncbi:MAG: type II secretion system minor pseudopilin GspK [Pseudomonadota bacterium]|nr:type II secretion system minor pseudopilin GspK [Pseudomonadota bacterium]